MQQQQTVTIDFDIADDLAAFRRGMEAIPHLTEAEAVALGEKLTREFLAALPRSVRVVRPSSEAEIECGIRRP